MPNPRKPRTFIPSKYTRYTVIPYSGNFRAVQIFAFRIFRGKSSQSENWNWEKLPRTGISHQGLWWVWFLGIETRITTANISSEGFSSHFAKICTLENFPLYCNKNREELYDFYYTAITLTTGYKISIQAAQPPSGLYTTFLDRVYISSFECERLNDTDAHTIANRWPCVPAWRIRIKA